MPTNEEGEFELVLGNKQLLSVFAIVAMLLGVFFVLGYVVGKNSAPLDTAARRHETPFVRTDAPSAMGERPSKRDNESTTQRASDSDTPEQPAETAPQPEAGKAKPAQAGATSQALTEPTPGQTFLQVSAVARSEADILVQVLEKKGFRAVLAPGPDSRTRILVGPVNDSAEIGKLKADLEQAGFKPFVRKY